MVIDMAKDARFTGSIQHTLDTIQLLYKTEYYTYDTLRILVRFLAGVGLVLAGLMADIPRALQIILLLVGCWLIISKDFPASVRADRALETRKAALPRHVCKFFEKQVELSGEGTINLTYDKFQYLIEDDGYLYLFLGRQSVCMVEKDSVEGGSPEALKEFVAERTGLRWRRNRSLLMMNLTDLRLAMKNYMHSR